MNTQSNPTNVAVLDGNRLFLEFLVTAISGWREYQICIQASDQIDFLSQLENLNDSFPDVLILDILLEKTNTYKLIKKIKDNWPYLKVLVLSTCVHEMTIREMQVLGVNGFLDKNLTSSLELRRALTNISYHGHYLSNLYSVVKSQQRKSIKSVLMTIPPREIEFLKLCLNDYTYDEIASTMSVSRHTVETYRDNLFARFAVHSKTALLVYAIRTGIVNLNLNQRSEIN
ncbi:MAG: response regulator transcription factor [Sphingobacteriales bacterium]|nr:MAG: response regulator transcription factor [Sphingobacteriales bacterium]